MIASVIELYDYIYCNYTCNYMIFILNKQNITQNTIQYKQSKKNKNKSKEQNC